MHTLRTTFFAFMALQMGCEQFHLFVDEDTAVDTAVEELTPNPSIDITWGEDGIELVIKNGTGYEFEFGLIESSAECAVDVEYGCWTAEGCISGYITPQETFSHPPYCHPLSDIGGTLAYSSSLIGVITGNSTDYVVQGEQTAFPAPGDESYEFSVTYYLKAVSVGANPTIECWAWGVNPDHFASEGCKAPIPVALDVNTSPRHQRFALPIGLGTTVQN